MEVETHGASAPCSLLRSSATRMTFASLVFFGYVAYIARGRFVVFPPSQTCLISKARLLKSPTAMSGNGV